MRFTGIRIDKKQQMKLSVHEAAWFMERMRYETQEFLISGFRDFLKRGSKWGSYPQMSKIARVCVSGDFGRTPSGDLTMKAFNGLVLLEVRQVANTSTLEQLKRRAMQSPATWAAFIGASGQTVKILVRAEPDNGELPQDEVSAEDFYTTAYHQLLPLYDGLLGCRVTRITPHLRNAFLMPLDTQPLVNEAAVPFRITDMPAATTDDAEQHLLALPEPPRDYREADMEQYVIHEHLYTQAAHVAHDRLKGTQRFTNAWWKSFVSFVINELCKQGLGEEEAVCVTWNNLRFKDDPRYMGLRSLLRTGDLVGAEFSYHTMPGELDVFDRETYSADPTEFHVVCTDAETGEPVYHRIDAMDDDGLEWIRASASMPLVSRPVPLDGRLLLDGGIADSIPLRYFQGQGFGRNVVILTQPKGFYKKRTKLMPLFHLFMRRYPAIIRAMSRRHLMYNDELAYLEEQEKQGTILLIYPQDMLPIGRTEQDETKMRRVYAMGRQAAETMLPRIEQFLEGR